MKKGNKARYITRNNIMEAILEKIGGSTLRGRMEEE
jgi:hypothetical protein